MNKYHKNHKLTWMELHRTGEEFKSDVIKRLGLPEAHMDCYACASTETEYLECESCPLDWVDGEKTHCICEHGITSPYRKWMRAKTPRTRKKYAKIIANMEWRTRK